MVLHHPNGATALIRMRRLEPTLNYYLQKIMMGLAIPDHEQERQIQAAKF